MQCSMFKTLKKHCFLYQTIILWKYEYFNNGYFFSAREIHFKASFTEAKWYYNRPFWSLMNIVKFEPWTRNCESSAAKKIKHLILHLVFTYPFTVVVFNFWHVCSYIASAKNISCVVKGLWLCLWELWPTLSTRVVFIQQISLGWCCEH